MILFDPECPFPFLAPDSHSYQEAQEHSAKVDNWLGFKAQSVEDAILQSDYAKANRDVEVWQGLPLQALQTPYTEIRFLLHQLELPPDSTVVDLGCSYGRMGHVIGSLYPQVTFIGYEVVHARVLEGQRVLHSFGYPRVFLKTQDLTAQDFAPALADIYFIYDFGSSFALEKTLQDLRQVARAKKIQVVARGRGIRHKIYSHHPWLCQMQPPRQFNHFTIFSS